MEVTCGLSNPMAGVEDPRRPAADDALRSPSCILLACHPDVTIPSPVVNDSLGILCLVPEGEARSSSPHPDPPLRRALTSTSPDRLRMSRLGPESGYRAPLAMYRPSLPTEESGSIGTGSIQACFVCMGVQAASRRRRGPPCVFYTVAIFGFDDRRVRSPKNRCTPSIMNHRCDASLELPRLAH